MSHSVLDKTLHDFSCLVSFRDVLLLPWIDTTLDGGSSAVPVSDEIQTPCS